MCGIAGAVSRTAGALPDPAVVERMADALQHRGPDGSGLWIAPSGRAVLAHRRLSVIDLKTGDQPMTYRDTLGLVYNGEIYNYRELRQELLDHGHEFRTTSDTEIMLRILDVHGVEGLNRLRGMFAFALWNDETQQLLLARDRVGKKPLFYAESNGCLYFSSTLGSLRAAVPKTTSDINLHAVDAFLDVGYVPAPYTIFQGVAKLAAGTYGVWSPRHPAHPPKPFWCIRKTSPFSGSYDEAIDRLDQLLDTAVKIRLRSDVPLGVFLSGGIDSTLITALAAKHGETTLDTFTIGFPHTQQDESTFARNIATHLQTNHHEFHVDASLFDILPRALTHFGEPFADAAALPLWTLSEHTRKHVTVALSGDGGDEGFGGYNWYTTMMRVARWRRWSFGASLLSPVARWARHSRINTVRRAGRLGDLISHTDAGGVFADLRSYFSLADASSLYGGDLRKARHAREAESRSTAQHFNDAEGDLLRKMRYADIRTYLADQMLPKVDVATMAHGLEARSPLLDQDVLTFAMSLPSSWLHDGHHGKQPLRTLLRRYVPSNLMERPKHGFDVPISRWLLTDLLKDTRGIVDGPLRQTEWFKPDGLEAMSTEHATGQRDHTLRLFHLHVLGTWIENHGG